MGMRYSAVFSDVAVAALQDLFEILAPTDAIVKIHSVRIGQSSEEGDAQAEMLPIEFVIGRGTVTSGSGGSTPTPVDLEAGFGAAGSVVEANNTTRMVVGTGSLHTALEDTFNVQVGFLYQPLPEEMIVISPGNRFTVALPSNPADSMTMSGTIVFEEIGG